MLKSQHFLETGKVIEIHENMIDNHINSFTLIQEWRKLVAQENRRESQKMLDEAMMIQPEQAEAMIQAERVIQAERAEYYRKMQEEEDEERRRWENDLLQERRRIDEENAMLAKLDILEDMDDDDW